VGVCLALRQSRGTVYVLSERGALSLSLTPVLPPFCRSEMGWTPYDSMLLSPLVHTSGLSIACQRLSCEAGSAADVTFASWQVVASRQKQERVTSRGPHTFWYRVQGTGWAPRGPHTFWAVSDPAKLEVSLREQLRDDSASQVPSTAVEMASTARRPGTGMTKSTQVKSSGEGMARSSTHGVEATTLSVEALATNSGSGGGLKIHASHSAGPSMTERSDRSSSREPKEGPGRQSSRTPTATPGSTPVPSDRSIGSGIGGLWSPAGGSTPLTRSPLASARKGVPIPVHV